MRYSSARQELRGHQDGGSSTNRRAVRVTALAELRDRYDLECSAAISPESMRDQLVIIDARLVRGRTPGSGEL